MTGSEQPFKAAIVGLGFIGGADQVSGDALGQNVADLDGTHAQALTDHPQVALVAGSSRDEGRRRRFEERTGVARTYADWSEMLDVEKPDLVSVATYSPYHAEITAACAEAGVRAVLCEKPIATRLVDADRAVRVCREHGTLLAINHQRRWHTLWRAARDEIRGDAIGEIRHVTAQWPTGRLGNVGTHVFDAICMLLDAKPCAVSATLDSVVPPDCRGEEFCDPGGWGVVAFSSGVRAFIDAAHDAACPMVVRVVGTLGQLIVCSDRAALELWDAGERPFAIPEQHESSMTLAVDDIVRCLTDGGEPASTGEDGIAALEIITGFHVSHQQDARWVTVPLADEHRQLEIRIG